MAPKKSTTRQTNGTPPPEPDLGRAFDRVMQLMAIPGKSGEEGRVAEFITGKLRQAGVPDSSIQTDSANQRTPVRGEVGNLICKLPGTKRTGRRLLTAHMDTVPICVGARPTRKGMLVRSADPKTGLGADDRAGAAVLLTAALEIAERNLPHPPLTFCWFVQEETGLHGARLVNKRLLGKPRLAFNWDGGSPLKLTIGATGDYRMTIEISGLASHAGGAPEWGVSAIAVAALAIADLHRGGWHGAIRKGKNLGTSNVGFIHGGEATNVVTDRVVLRAEARSHDPVFRRRILREIEKTFHRAAQEVKNAAGVSGAASIDSRLDYESFRLPPDEPCVQTAASAVASIGKQPECAIANGGLDANWLVVHGIPSVTLGCGQQSPHTVAEALDVDQFQDACRIALRLATATETASL